MAHRRGARIDDLVRDFGPACGAGDDVVRAKGIALIAKAKLALAFEDEEQLLLPRG
ncbi:MAG: hypothetical protein R3C55_00990 [Parvularculaceae bacterium]